MAEPLTLGAIIKGGQSLAGVIAAVVYLWLRDRKMNANAPVEQCVVAKEQIEEVHQKVGELHTWKTEKRNAEAVARAMREGHE